MKISATIKCNNVYSNGDCTIDTNDCVGLIAIMSPEVHDCYGITYFMESSKHMFFNGCIDVMSMDDDEYEQIFIPLFKEDNNDSASIYNLVTERGLLKNEVDAAVKAGALDVGVYKELLGL